MKWGGRAGNQTSFSPCGPGGVVRDVCVEGSLKNGHQDSALCSALGVVFPKTFECWVSMQQDVLYSQNPSQIYYEVPAQPSYITKVTIL